VHERSPLLLFFPGWVSAFVFGRRIFLRDRLAELSAGALRHEVIHACQYAERGRLRFLWRYLWTERRLPYRQKTFEREAYDHQDDDGYLRRRWPGVTIEVRAPDGPHHLCRDMQDEQDKVEG
jgi:hypothetical protein